MLGITLLLLLLLSMIFGTKLNLLKLKDKYLN